MAPLASRTLCTITAYAVLRQISNIYNIHPTCCDSTVTKSTNMLWTCTIATNTQTAVDTNFTGWSFSRVQSTITTHALHVTPVMISMVHAEVVMARQANGTRRKWNHHGLKLAKMKLWWMLGKDERIYQANHDTTKDI